MGKSLASGEDFSFEINLAVVMTELIKTFKFTKIHEKVCTVKLCYNHIQALKSMPQLKLSMSIRKRQSFTQISQPYHSNVQSNGMKFIVKKC